MERNRGIPPNEHTDGDLGHKRDSNDEGQSDEGTFDNGQEPSLSQHTDGLRNGRLSSISQAEWRLPASLLDRQRFSTGINSANDALPTIRTPQPQPLPMGTISLPAVTVPPLGNSSAQQHLAIQQQQHDAYTAAIAAFRLQNHPLRLAPLHYLVPGVGTPQQPSVYPPHHPHGRTLQNVLLEEQLRRRLPTHSSASDILGALASLPATNSNSIASTLREVPPETLSSVQASSGTRAGINSNIAAALLGTPDSGLDSHRAASFWSGNLSSSLLAPQSTGSDNIGAMFSPQQRTTRALQGTTSPEMGARRNHQTVSATQLLSAETNRFTPSPSQALASQSPASAEDPVIRAARIGGDNGNRQPTVSTSVARVLFVDGDEDFLTEYQCLLRKQLEVFEASENDLRGSTQGRNTPILLGQVGLRCRHCANLPLAARTKGAVYYSQTIDGVYQIAQNMSKVHLCQRCYRIPPDVQGKLIALKQDARRATGGKEYWGKALRAMGVYEDGKVLRIKKQDDTNTEEIGEDGGSLAGVYQIAQNMSKVHLCQRCYRIPPNVQGKLIALKQDARRATGGKEYWGKALRAMGVYEDGKVFRIKKQDDTNSEDIGEDGGSLAG